VVVIAGVVILGEPIGEGIEGVACHRQGTQLAARLQSIAQPNCVVISAETRDLLHGGFECEYLGTHQLKGFAKPVPAWRLARALRPPPGTPCTYGNFGRASERGVLDQCWARVCAGQGQVVHVSGDAGIGKSNLCESFLDTAKGPSKAVLRCGCSALHINTAFHPVVEEIIQSAEIDHDDSATTRLHKLAALLGACGPDGAPLLPVFAHLLALPSEEAYPEVQMRAVDARKTIIDGLVQRLCLLSRLAPVVLFLEDVQWSDPSTKDFIAAAIKRWRQARSSS
jgi:hypothetical protein